MSQATEYNQLIKETTYNIIKIALENGFNKNSKFIDFYCKSIRDAFNPESTVRLSSLKIFPDENSYEDKKNTIIVKYRDRLQKDLLNLYHLYYLASIEERDKQPKIITDDYIDNLLDNLI